MEASHLGKPVEPRQLVRTKVRFAESLQSQGLQRSFLGDVYWDPKGTQKNRDTNPTSMRHGKKPDKK